MRKIITTATLAMAALAMAAPAHADNGSNFGDGVNAVNNWNFTGAAVCFQELAVAPIVGDSVHDCSNGNVLNHSGR
ncbi:hypothetical protein ACOT81_21010 [Streptomyces sp. WI04-05B]|uniref:hypothetical protein n=1 Tax=Streptomyces TaxID=1883 RepID=UPI0029A20095|nr:MULTISPECIES: hypothetical protein [unclassified Streptomyces]MDX2544101.1 hypothetical protein [Streptomyces sp. WI04-05B]MDX2584517.1 hypothetical protein [Streptomyces sp. WI04-05A]